ncbi:TetR/AcrR family transcriptional regulator [Pseudomarimonas arenosa]|uniref:TetR/AcrR family transcriptional regulator n=1 Tax=Pseudomarimonas arenosa TaxID=2774145 RepID=A0AAW3ZN51_9GAMM|nr:TetR/AcrR family transcriptional regulator [Pseudomarimonas arenosa]MBD8526345.1 TetR/AcrR family transcriptional regulator [Pseudomarimonas arenosa]
MPRPPLARTKILLAARQIVERSGAGALTYDELATVSGLTRGGITYHFPTKDDLLRSLLDDDIKQWRASEQASRPSNVDPALAELIGFIRSHTSEDESKRRFVAGMLSAAVHQPELLDSCRSEIARQRGDQRWDEAGLKCYLLRLAAAGLFWEELFQLHPLPTKVRKQLIALMERKAEQWSSTEPTAETATTDAEEQHKNR